MKKFIVLFIAVIMLIATTSIASASVNFEFWAQCQNESNTDVQTDPTGVFEYKYIDDDKVYVKHWVYGGSADYTNFFRAKNLNSNALHGQKWIATNKNIPIESTAITASGSGVPYTPAGRGNSKHYFNDGNYQVSLHGPFDADIQAVD